MSIIADVQHPPYKGSTAQNTCGFLKIPLTCTMHEHYYSAGSYGYLLPFSFADSPSPIGCHASLSSRVPTAPLSHPPF